MAKTPAEILRKTKATDKKDDKDNKGDDKDKDAKPSRKNAILEFIAKNKKATAK
jgi:hypothetical protein